MIRSESYFIFLLYWHEFSIAIHGNFRLLRKITLIGLASVSSVLKVWCAAGRDTSRRPSRANRCLLPLTYQASSRKCKASKPTRTSDKARPDINRYFSIDEEIHGSSWNTLKILIKHYIVIKSRYIRFAYTYIKMYMYIRMYLK